MAVHGEIITFQNGERWKIQSTYRKPQAPNLLRLTLVPVPPDDEGEENDK